MTLYNKTKLFNKSRTDNATIIKVNNLNLQDVTEDQCKRDFHVIFNCNCGELNCKKSIRYCIDMGLFCKKCSVIIKEKKRQETIKKLNEEIPERKTNIAKKISKTCKDTFNKLNEKFPNRQNEINKKHSEKHIELNEKYSYRQNKMNEQKKITMLKNYGVEHALQLPEFCKKAHRNSFFRKNYELPSKNIIQVQGDEPYALDELLHNLNYKEDDLIIGFNNSIKLSCKYIFNEKNHVYHPDIYIISENKIIEVKSEYYYIKDYEKNIAKCKGCIKLGYDFEFWIYNEKKIKSKIDGTNLL